MIIFINFALMLQEEKYMWRCIELANLGVRSVAPNPMVGAVLVVDDRIIGEGYHQFFGGPHAEVNAIQSVKNSELLSRATLYVSLEPCSHQGKTPPCVDLILRSKIPKVVIGCLDSHVKVKGKGIEKLKNAGLDVKVGVLEQECRNLNKRFFTFHERRRPYVILKWAQSKDGFLDKVRQPDEVGINWVSSDKTKVLVHKWRSEEQSILVGRKTIQNDNPALTVRELSGINPIRIVIDSQKKLNLDLQVFSDDAQTIVFNRIENNIDGNVEWIKIAETSTELILEELYKRNIMSVFVEGGSRTLQYFIFGNVWDEARVIVGDVTFGSGTKAPAIAKAPAETIHFASDQIYFYYRK